MQFPIDSANGKNDELETRMRNSNEAVGVIILIMRKIPSIQLTNMHISESV